jgi:hypothetical protein
MLEHSVEYMHVQCRGICGGQYRESKTLISYVKLISLKCKETHEELSV